MLVQDLIRTARMTQLEDADGVTWSDTVMIHALNEALRILALLRPDATSTIQVISTLAGTRQFIPTDGERLLKVVRNVNADNSIGRAIRQTSHGDMDAMSPDWHNAPNGERTHEFMFDERTPKWFFIYPPVGAGKKLEIEYSKKPPELTINDMEDELPVSVIFSQPLQELMLYKLLSGDSSRGQGSTNHYNSAVQMLGIKSQADTFSLPKKGGSA